MSTRILQVCFKCLSIANFIEKYNKNFNWTSSRISTGHPLESTGRLVGMGPSTCSLGAHSVLGVFEGAHAWVLESEHMLSSLVLGLDARRVLGEHQGITEWHKIGKGVGENLY